MFNDELGIPETSDGDSGIAYAADMFLLALARQRESKFGLNTKLNRLSPSSIKSCILARV